MQYHHTPSITEMSGEGRTVCVTGASGYIASWIIKLLLQHGYTIRATVRDPKDPTKTEHLLALQGAKERLQLYKAELVDEGCFDSVVDGCHFVFHVASPVRVQCSNPRAEIIDPAVKGTLNVLKACAKASSVQRVVLTSSVATALFTGKPITSQTLVDETWFSDPQICEDYKNWYSVSKTLAERDAWEFAKENGIDLVVINPGMVLGPFLHSNSHFSMDLMFDLIKGERTYETYCLVDIRDVVYAHIQAAEVPSASGRYLLVERVLALSEVLKIIEEIDPTLSPKVCKEDMKPSEAIGSSSVYQVSKERAKTLGIEFKIPAETSIKDTITSLKEMHLLK